MGHKVRDGDHCFRWHRTLSTRCRILVRCGSYRWRYVYGGVWIDWKDWKDITQMNDQLTHPRIMPKRWFYGDTMHRLISGLVVDHTGDVRPLIAGERRLGAFIVPPFQRGLVWTERQKVRLIESIYMGLPIGAIVYNQTRVRNPCDGWLLDGQQRVTAIVDYMSGDIIADGWRYPDLPQIERRHFERMGVAVIETRIEDEDQCRDIYDRLAYGGTAHEPKTQSS